MASVIKKSDLPPKVTSSSVAYDAASNLFNDLEYAQSKQMLEQALALDPANEAAKEKLQVVNSLLGIHVERIAVKIRELENSERVKQQESLIQLANALSEAKSLEARNSAVPNEMLDEHRAQLFTERLDNLRKAQDKFRRVKEILNWMPPTFDLPDERVATDAGLLRIKNSIANTEDELNDLRRVAATRDAETARIQETELFRTRIGKLNKQVMALYGEGDYRAPSVLRFVSCRSTHLTPKPKVGN